MTEAIPSSVRPRVGLLFLSSAWMSEVGLQSAGSALAQRQRAAAARVQSGLSTEADVVAPGICGTAAEAARAGGELAAAGCDLVVVAPLVWSEDQVLRAALAPLGRAALLLCTLLPTPRLPRSIPFSDMLAGSGVVGTLQASGMLSREGRPPVAVCGNPDDPALYAAILSHARACAALRAVRDARIGVLPFRSDAMSVTWVDEFGLRAATGIELVPLECAQIARRAGAASPSACAALVEELRRLPADIRVPAGDLESAVRITLALEEAADERGLAGLACNDIAPELHQSLGMRPCIPSPRLCRRGFVVAMEADVAACSAMLLLRVLLGAVPFYTEILNAGPLDNLFLMGHAGWHDPACRDPARAAAVVPDEEYRSNGGSGGAALVFAYPPGPVTAVNAVQGARGLRLTAFEGESLQGESPLAEECALLCRPDGEVPALLDRWIRRGVSQHWVVVPGRRASLIENLCQWWGVRCER